MKHRRMTAALGAALLVAAGLSTALAPTAVAARRGASGDAVVVAVLDDGFAPYHWDYLSTKMPQHQDGTHTNDLPLYRAPHTWLPGFPSLRRFESYKPLRLTLNAHDSGARIATLDKADTPDWMSVTTSTRKKQHYYWIPGTKVIGALDFTGSKIHASASSHGTGTTSSSVGNLHGTCPECLLVFITVGDARTAEAAIDWAMAQPWIDVISNSYGHSDYGYGKTYTGSDTGAQRRASERGQTIFFSAGNGIDNSFVLMNSTYLSSQKGPDWLITVGAVSPDSRGSYVGHGRPVDIAGVGDSYPSAYTARTVGGTGGQGFSGTSNAAPTIAGLYARALWHARRDLKGPSRIQRNGAIARGSGFRCGAARRDCELRDNLLTAPELRHRLFMGAVHTEVGTTDPYGIVPLPAIGEDEFLAEGYGTYLARAKRGASWLTEFDRILGPLEGRAKVRKRPNGERAWMVVDSFCRQKLWGGWREGNYVEGRSELPGVDANWPTRSTLEATCPALPPL